MYVIRLCEPLGTVCCQKLSKFKKDTEMKVQKGQCKTNYADKERKRERERKSTSGDSVVFNEYFPSSSVSVI